MACHKRELRASSREACELACQNKETCTSMWHADEKPSDRDRYYYIFDKMGWKEANEFCKSNNSRLAVVENWEDQEELRKITDGTATRMVERIGDAMKDNAASKTMEVAGRLTRGASVFFSKTAWIGITTVPTDEFDHDFEYVWDGAPDLDNMKTGGSPVPNAYNWGWSVEYFDRESRQFTNDPKCGVVERNMWNRRDCDDDLPFICERLGKCEICDASGQDNTYISTRSESEGERAAVNDVALSHPTLTPRSTAAPGAVTPSAPTSTAAPGAVTPSAPTSTNYPAEPVQAPGEVIDAEEYAGGQSTTFNLTGVGGTPSPSLAEGLFDDRSFRDTENLNYSQTLNETLRVEKVRAVNEIIELLKIL